MKKFLALTAAFVMALSMAACGNSDDDDSVVPKKSMGTLTEADGKDTPADDFKDTPASFGKTYTGDGYSFQVDDSVWNEQTPGSSVDFNFSYTDTTGEVNFNVLHSDLGTTYTDAAGEQLSATLKETYNSYGYDEIKIIQTTYNGRDALQIDLHAPSNVFGKELKQAQYYIFEGSLGVVFTFTASPEKYDSSFSDFQKSMDSLVFN